MTLHTLWPWAGLIFAPVVLALLFFTDRLRGDRKLDRRRDLQWLAWLFLPVYMLHQLAVNLAAVLGGGLIAALWGRKRPLLIPATYGIVLFNGVTHIAPAILRQRYNPGLLTAVVPRAAERMGGAYVDPHSRSGRPRTDPDGVAGDVRQGALDGG